MTETPEELIRRRQRDRARVMGIVLGGLAILIFLIAIAKIKAGMGR
ncbi:MAG: hypothetical protein K2X73_14710 [Sphingomonas sp.]|jgi:hypothetical protein|nr:hypothetical protein [Sphingomonas sp.]MBX9883209.1 hypothetical protein [Sphingomonas sp.]